MRKIKEILRLRDQNGLGSRAIAQSCGISASTVGEYLARAREAGLSWPLPEELSEEKLKGLLFGEAGKTAKRPQPDWGMVHEEVKRKGVTLLLVWEEYKSRYSNGYQYSQFCELYRKWKSKVDVCMRQNHKGGEKLFVDYSGLTMPVTDGMTGQVREAEIFVATLGASNYTYAEATWSQQLPDWISSHVRTWEFLGGVTEMVVPDNLRSGVSGACRYEPDINPTYQEMAAHYGTAVVPARAGKPRDKAKVESGVQGIQRRILAPLRNRTFLSLAELNGAIRELLTQYNQRPFQKMPGSRQSVFEKVDKPALKPLPSQRYEYAEWRKATVNIDYHVAVDRHNYSVPYQLVRQKVDVRLTATTVECFHKGKRVASHLRSYEKCCHTTVREHMPKAHQKHVEWSPERLVRWAGKSGGSVAKVVEFIMGSREHPQQGFRACLGIMRLGKGYDAERLEAACTRALRLNACSYKSIASILKHGLDQQPLPENRSQSTPIEHTNVRGAGYYDNPSHVTTAGSGSAPVPRGERRPENAT